MTGYGALGHASVLEDATLYILGELAEEPRRSFEEHLRGCASCASEIRRLSDAAAVFAGMAETAPPTDLHARLRQRVAAATPALQPWKQWDAEAGGSRTIRREDESDWQDTAIPGIRVRNLFVDAVNDRITMLVRMQPGTAYPSHRHGGAEECYVIEGDLLVGDYRMRAGDYQRVDSGSTHCVQSTENGCLLYIVSSAHDEMLGAGS
jgi:quercetin dioxygenase-like cupin family protein